MGFLRNLKIQKASYDLTMTGLKFFSNLQKSEPDIAPTGPEALESLGDELAILSRDLCENDDERILVIKGLEKALKDYGYRKTSSLKVVAALTLRILAGKPVSGLHDEISDLMLSANSSKIQKAYNQARIFMMNSLQFVDNQQLNKEKIQIAAAFYFSGSTDYLTQQSNLNNDDFVKVMYKILLDFGLPYYNAENFIKEFNTACAEPFANNAFKDGWEAAKSWYSSNNTSAYLNLSRLIFYWSDEKMN